MQNVFKKLRVIFLAVLLLASMVLAMIRLMKIQVVEGAELLKMSVKNVQGQQDIAAPRGEIVDINGNPLVANRVAFNVIIEQAFFPKDVQEQNDVILRFAKLLQNEKIAWEETIPITKTQPYSFISGKDSTVTKVLEDLRLNKYATAQNCIDEIIKKYKIADKYTDEEKRIIAGIRYEMIFTQFSVNKNFTFAKDIPSTIVAKIKELSFQYPGIDVIETAVRVYPDGTIFPHGLGTVGPIYAEEYATLKKSGYNLNDQLGKAGVEKAMENELRGESGKRSVVLSSKNQVVSIEETKAAVPGDTVKLTIDSAFQKKVQAILANHIHWLNETQTDPVNKGANASAGAVVVMDVKTGAVLAMVTNPNYDINDYKKSYEELKNAKYNPLFNRAIDGLYRPGSTFKTITATAALNEKIINENSTVVCNHVYTFYDDYQPKCVGTHGSENVKEALRDSCNIFFYDTGKNLGIDKLVDYEKQFGFSTDLKFELGGTTGFIASKETFAKKKMPWNRGELLQAAIGQSEIGVSPLNMAVQASTLANKGVRYRPYIVDSVLSYDGKTVVKKTQPEVVQTIPDKTGKTFDIIKEGMKMAGAPANLTPYPGDTTPALPYPVALKTGTPQLTETKYNSTAIGYYPADNPEIAFAMVVEDGWNAKMMVKKIIEAYYGLDTAVQSTQNQPAK